MAECDYLILGGGLAGCVLASRIKEYIPDASVTVIEAGPDEHDNPLITEPMATASLEKGPLRYHYKTVPQTHVDGRIMYNGGGRVLSGSSAVNYAAWTRGDVEDYDHWAKIVGDERWSYERQLPYFKRTETHYDSEEPLNTEKHGFKGPIHSTPALSRTYAVTENVYNAYRSIGIEANDDINGGHNKGISPYVENWREGKRQPAGKAYGLKGVDVRTNSIVKTVLLENSANGNKKAVGAALNSGETIKAKKEVILSCGAIRTPQILLLSGIGPNSELEKHGIKQLVDAPEVGRNLHDHASLTHFYRVREPERGLVALHKNFNDPSYLAGIPSSHIIIGSVPSNDMQKALETDGVGDVEAHLERSHYELLPMYLPTEVPMTNLNIPLDGTIMSFGVLNMLPTSRGSITLASKDAKEQPNIDPNYLSTHADRLILRTALRQNLQAFETPDGQEIVEQEYAPPDYPTVTSESSDEELDRRVRRQLGCFYHLAGSAAMGKVVDGECRVIGVDGLRVVDASVLPCPLSAHYQVPIYALAEQMADIICGRV